MNAVDAKTEVAPDLLASRFLLVSRLADDLAHEIKNPLHAMVINLVVLRRRLAAGDPEIALERAAVIEHEIDRTHRLVDLLLKLVRPQRTGDQHAHSLAGALDEVLPLIALRARLAHVPLIADDVDVDAAIGTSHGAVKFALLALTEPIIDRLRALERPEEGRGLRLSVEHGDEVRIRLETEAGALPDPAARTLAGHFLAEGGGRIEPDPNEPAIYIVLPRVTGT
jgi:signal transduction histidine kinase